MGRGGGNTVQAFWVALGSLSTFAISILSAAILSRYFDKTDYGTYKQILYVYSTLLVVFTAGLPRVFAYFLPRHSIEEGKAIVNKISKILFLAGLAFALFLFFCSDTIASLLNNQQLGYALKVFSPVPLFLVPTLGIEGIFSSYKKTVFIAYYNVLSRMFTLLLIVVPVVYLEGTYIHAIYGWVIASLITLIVALFFKSIPFKGVNSNTTSLSSKEIFTYSVPLVIASIWGIAIKSADQFYISRFFGPDTFAEFSNGFIELPLVGMVTASASVVLMPVFSRALQCNEGLSEVVQVWQSALRKSATIIYPLVVFFIFYANEIMSILYSEQYYSSSVYFRINMILNFFNIVIFSPLILALGETKFYAKMHMYTAIVAWLGGYVVVCLFNSPVAVALFSVSLSIIKVLIAINFVSNKLSVKFFELFPIKLLTKTLIHTSVMCTLVLLIVNEFPSINDVLRTTISFIIYGALILVTSKIFRINYIDVFLPIVNKFLNVRKI